MIKLKFLRFMIGINIMALAVALSKVSQLGTSPIASIPNVLSEVWKQSIGLYMLLFMLFLIILQIIIVGHQINKVKLFNICIQMFPGAIFGYFINCYVNLLKILPPFDNYFLKISLLLISIVILALGVVIEVKADFILMPGEGLPQTIAKHFHLPFAKVKLWSDLSIVFTALILSFLLSRPFLGIREGTLLATVFTAPCVSMITYSLDKLK